MKVFLDECVDWRLLRSIQGHDVKSARQMGWTEIKNGKLLALVAGEFDAFVTVDQNLPFQQNLAALDLAVIVLRGRTSRLRDLQPLIPALLATLEKIVPGNVYPVGLEQG